MKTKEFIFEIKKPRVKMPKQRDPNWQTMQAKATSGAGGQHRDEKRAEKLGDVKHKKDLIPMEDQGVAEGEQQVYKVVALDKGNALKKPTKMKVKADSIEDLFGRLAANDWYPLEINGIEVIAGKRLKQGVAEATGDEKFDKMLKGVTSIAGDKSFDDMMRQIKKGTKKQATADRREREAASREQARNAFGPSPADRLSIRSDKGVREVSDFGEPREILEDVLRVLEREVEWPLTDVMDPREVKQLLAPVVKAVNDKMMSMEEAFGRKNNYYNPLEYERDQQRQMDYEKQAFKRSELQHELGHEDDPDFERKLRDKDRGPWYIRIDGKIYKQKGEPKVFDWKKGANNYALAILKNKPELKDKTVLTRNPVDQ